MLKLTACNLCKGACCKSLPYQTAKQIIIDTVELDPELGNNTLRRLQEVDGKTVCAFLDEDDGCVLSESERPSICTEYKCDLFVSVEENQNLSKDCFDHARIENDNPFKSDYRIICSPKCPLATDCSVANCEVGGIDELYGEEALLAKAEKEGKDNE